MKKKWDVIIVGGGTTGVIAAVAAARGGASTLLIEQYGFLGGAATYGSCFHGFFACNGQRAVGGIPEELVQKLKRADGSPGHLTGGEWGLDASSKLVYSQTPYDIETYKYIAQEMVLDAGAELLLHSHCTGTIMDKNTIKGVIVSTKSGEIELQAKAVIDATGDGDVAVMSGAEYEFGGSGGISQNVTLLFSLGNVDFDRLFEYSKKNERIKTWGEWHTRAMKGRRFGEDKEKWLSFSGKVILDEDINDGKELSCGFRGYRTGEVRLNVTRSVGIDGTKSEDLTKAEIQERKKVYDIYLKFKKHIPGCENAFLLTTAVQVGIRESRRVIGDYILSAQDVVNDKKFDDCIAKGAYTIDIHDPTGGHVHHTFTQDGNSYEIPYKSLLPCGIDGLLVAGRCLSADHEAQGSARNMATVMAMGHAAGTAAAIAVTKGVSPRQVDIVELRKSLLSEGAIV